MTTTEARAEPPAVASGLDVLGSGWKSPVWTARSDGAGGVVLVVSDWCDGAKWLGIKLSRDDLARMYAVTCEPAVEPDAVAGSAYPPGL